MASAALWQRFQRYFLRYDELGFSIDISRMNFADEFFAKMRPKIDNAFAVMRELEAGAIANPDEHRMVGHYWLRNPALAPTAQLRAEIEQTNARIKQFAADLHRQKRFTRILHIGIGGSALGPQFIADALGSTGDPMQISFFDNTDPDGFDRVFNKIDPPSQGYGAAGNQLSETLVVVVSKSGGTKETRNGMLEGEAKFTERGLDFSKHAVAVTEAGSELDKRAEKNGWLARFPMWDWVGGRTSVMSPVGLVPAALQGFN